MSCNCKGSFVVGLFVLPKYLLNTIQEFDVQRQRAFLKFLEFTQSTTASSDIQFF